MSIASHPDLKFIVAVVLVIACAMPVGASARASMVKGQGRNRAACLAPETEAHARHAESLVLDRLGKPAGSIQADSRAIRTMTTRDGKDDPRLIPQLLNLGSLYTKSGIYGRAASEYSRALYVWRANQGLNNLDQIPIIDLLISSDIAARRWQRAGRAYSLMDWIYRRNFGPDDPHLLPMLRRLRQWNLDAYNKDTGRSLDAHYRIATRAYAQGVRIIEKCTGDPRLALCYLRNLC